MGELTEWCPRYLYLPRLRDRETIIEAVREGASVLLIQDTFATAEDYDEARRSLPRPESRRRRSVCD